MKLDLFNNNQNLHQATADLFKEQLKIAINLLPEKAFTVSQYFGENVKDLNIITNIYTVGIVNQDSFSNSESLNDDSKVKIDYDTIFIVAVELEKPQNRSSLAQLTRKLNQKANKNEKGNPLIVVFRYEDKITISSLERQARIDKDWREGEKISNTKVSMLKDIDIENPHAAHERILLELGNHKAKSFDELYKYWQEKLNTKALNNEFYKELFKWYLWAKEHVLFPNDNQEDIDTYKSESLIRFISRLLFVWFMKEKGLITDKLFEVSELKKILKNFDTNSDKNSYYKAILQNLFFATLNVPIDDRKWIDGKKRNKAQHGDPLIYRYENEFTNSEDAIENIFMQIPFLNGGLFDCLDDRENEIFIDGFTKNEKKQPKFPNFVFFGTREDVDLSHHFGDDKDELKKWKKNSIIGIIDLLNNFKFTVEENTPLEIDVALDPELLGKVFENLLASFNPETKATARKQTGSFYTPREIVNYMVDESLKQHLKTHLPNLENEIEHLFKNENVDLNDFAKKSIVEKLFECKILDPACGSGAYPMGILHKMVELFNILDSQNFYLKEIEGEKLDQLIISAQHLSDTQTRNQTIDALENQKEILKKAEFDYVRKLYIIENCIYGVDIQPIAIQISKLRFFISLLVEQNKKENQKNFGIEALPNMDFKLVAANTLIAPPQEEKGIGLFENQNQFFDRFEKLAHEYFKLRTPEEKRGKKEELKMLIQEKVTEKVQMIRRDEEAHTFNGVAKNKKSEIALADLNQSKTLWESYPNLFKEKSVAFFDIPYFFPKVKDGFDVVIGNPPYVQMQKDGGKLAELYKNQNFETFQRTGDIYALFYEQGIKMLKNKGNLNFITSNKWMRANYGESLRNYFIKHNPYKLIDLGADVFENATVDTNIIVVTKEENKNQCLALDLTKEKNITDFKQFEDNWMNFINLTSENWTLLNNIELTIRLKAEKFGTPLKHWDVNINRGITSGYNEAYIIDNDKRNEFINLNKKNKSIIKPLLRGKDIKRYSYNKSNLWLIFIPWHFPLHNDNSISGNSIIAEKEFEKDYPEIYNHLLNYKKELSNRNKTETGIRYEWYALQRCANSYYDDFEKEKIIYSEISIEPSFFIDDNNFFIGNTAYILTGKNLKYLNALLNCKFVTFIFSNFYSVNLGAKGFRYLAQYMENLPIPEIPEIAQQPFIRLVNQILEGKKEDKDTSGLEHQIDMMVYHLYGLSYEEACVIDKELSKELSKEDFDRFKM
jgi:hypothetical protein